MKDLLELARIVTKRKLKPVELLNEVESGKEKSKIQEFYDLLQEGKVEDEDEAAQLLYGTDKQASSYQKLRSVVKNRMISALFLIDLKQASYKDRQRAYYECYRDWAAAKMLFGKQARTAAITISRKLLKVARQFEFTELLVDILQTLRVFHATIEGDFKKYEKYNTELKQMQALWMQENRAEELYLELSIAFVNTKATRAGLQEKARAYYRSIEQLLQEYDSYRLHLCGRLIEVSEHTVVNDYAQTIGVCERAIAFFKGKRFEAPIPLQIFYYQQAICFLQFRRFDEAAQAAEHSSDFIEPGTFNWFKLKELLMLLYMHSERYEQAFTEVEEVLAHIGFSALPENVQETWKIAQAYCHFLGKAGQIKELSDSTFRLARFLNEMELFSRDKKGMNIHLLLLELLLQIADGHYGALIDRVEAMDKYRTRYLGEEELRRSNHFLKMLLHLPKNAFDRAKAQEKAAEDHEALLALPIELANQAYTAETIPYEKLWELTLGFLK